MDFEGKTPEEVIYNFKQKFKGRPLKISPRTFLIGIIIFAGVILLNSFYTIKQDEAGIVLRFGKYVRLAEPGLHFKLPLIERIFPVEIEHNYQEEFGYRTKVPGVQTTYSQKSYDDESLMLTGDLNVLEVEWIVQYKVKDPYSYLFRISDMGPYKKNKTLRDLSESIVRKTIGDYAFDEIFDKRSEINNYIKKELQEALDSYKAGVKIETVRLQGITAPDPVKPAFNEVNEAEQEKDKLINQAMEIYNKKVPQAAGEAKKIINEAEGYALERINKAEGDAKRFLLLRKEYMLAKDITLKRLYLENMQEVLSKVRKKYIVDPEEKGILPLLRLENEKE